jgi:hypothetical protein
MVFAHGVKGDAGEGDHFVELLSFDQGKGPGKRGVEPAEQVPIEFGNAPGCFL